MTDNITLPRAVVELMREAFTHVVCVYQDEKDMAALAALDAALAEPEKERAEVAAPARGVGTGQTNAPTGKSYREHVTDGSPCWCNPELNYRDPETGAEVWVHRREQ
jgi:hypothetical protein